MCQLTQINEYIFVCFKPLVKYIFLIIPVGSLKCTEPRLCQWTRSRIVGSFSSVLILLQDSNLGPSSLNHLGVRIWITRQSRPLPLIVAFDWSYDKYGVLWYQKISHASNIVIFIHLSKKKMHSLVLIDCEFHIIMGSICLEKKNSYKTIK